MPPGSYRIEIDPDQAFKLKVRLVSEAIVEAKSDGGLTGDIDLDLEPAA